MSEFANKAVFLSYASQDVEAAGRICEALRAAGVEVWFDQSELRGGDAWDAKIRKQIKECALFVPVISANTQARREGYFRIEWKLAAQRTHAIAEGTPFLLPLLVGEVAEGAALVPAEFREVQWTRLRLDEAPTAFASRVRVVLDGDAGAASDRDTPIERAPPKPSARMSRAWVKWVPLLGIAMGLLFALRPFWKPERKDDAAIESRLNALLRNSREEAAMMEDLTRRATDREPQSASVWSQRAFVQSVYLIRSWDTGEKRRQDAQTFAQRALAIDANDTRAIAVLANVFIAQGAYAEAEAAARRALRVRPDDPGSNRVLAIALSAQGKIDEAVAMMEETVRQFPTQSGPHYNLALLHENKTVPDFEAALRSFDAAQKALSNPEPSANVLMHKAALLVGARGDFAGARALLDEIRPVDRMEDRAVGTTMMIALLERDATRALAAGGQTARTYFEDLYVPGPKAWRTAHAYRLQGKESLAQQEWRTAETVLRARLAINTGSGPETAALAVTLAWLGQRSDAEKIMDPIEAQVKESPPRVIGFSPDHLRLLYLSYYYAGLGEAGRAVPYIRQLLNRRELMTDRTLPLDPWWDKIRDRPEFMALVNDAAAKVVAAPSVATPDPKSVVVLPFANLSGDKDQEYFSDGLTEEIRDALARERDLRVVPRTSSFAFKERNLPLPEIARALNVAQVVEGTVRRSGGVVRITATLTRISDGFVDPLPALTRELKEGADLFAIQEAVARAVVEKLTQRASIASVAVLTKNQEAYEAYLRGRALQIRAGPSVRGAVPFYERAVALDPKFALAWARLGEARFQAFYSTNRRPELVQQSKEEIERALTLQPDLPEALIARAEWLDAVNSDFAAAERDLSRAAALQSPTLELRRAQMSLAQGRGDGATALRLGREALELDPHNGDFAHELAGYFAQHGDWVAADRLFVRAAEIQGVFHSSPYYNRAMLRSWWRGVEAGLRVLERTPKGVPPGVDAFKAELLVRAGREVEARSLAEKLLRQASALSEFHQLRLAEIAGGELGRQRMEQLVLYAESEFKLGNRAPRIRHVYIGAQIGLGNREAARRELLAWAEEVRAITSTQRRLNAAGHLLSSYAALGMVDETLAVLRELRLAGRRFGLALGHSPEAVRSDPRFQDIMREEAAWAKALPEPPDP